jgi:hypothetical protein
VALTETAVTGPTAAIAACTIPLFRSGGSRPRYEHLRRNRLDIGLSRSRYAAFEEIFCGAA